MSPESCADQAIQDGKRSFLGRIFPVIAVPVVLIGLLLKFFSVTSAFQTTDGDLAVSKIVNTAIPAVGETITYTVVVTNNGSVALSGVVLTDTLPSGLTFSSAFPSTGAYTSTTGIWSIGSLSSEISATLRLIASVNLDASGTITNTVQGLSSDLVDPNLSNNTASAAITIQTATVTPTATGTPPTATVTGTPPTATVTGTPPTETVTGTPPTATVTGTPATATPTVTGTPPTPTPTGTITPNISITNAVSPNQARVGQNLTFTIRVTNNGTAPALNVSVSDQFTSVLNITQATTTKGSATTNSSTRTVSVTVGTVNPNETVTITITTQVNNTVTTTTNLNNTASLTYTFGGSNQTRTSNSVSFQVVGATALPGTGWGPPLDDQSGGRVSARRSFGQNSISDSSAAWAASNRSQFEAAQEPRRPIPLLSLFFLVLGLGSLVLGLLLKAFRRERVLFVGIGVWLLLLAAILSPATMNWLNPVTEEVSQLPTPFPTEPAVLTTQEPEAIQIIWPTPVIVETLPDYPIPTPEITPTSGEAGETVDTSPVQQILIPALGVDTVVKYVPFDGLTWLIAGLQQEVAWLGETSWPGLGGNTALAGHITLRNGGNGPFRYLEELVPGDEITLFTKQKVYKYQVIERQVVSPTDLSVVEPTSDQQITLITCTGWDVNAGFYQERLVVIADLVNVEPRKIVSR